MEPKEQLEILKIIIELFAFLISVLYIIFRLVNGALNGSLELELSAKYKEREESVTANLTIKNTSIWSIYIKTITLHVYTYGNEHPIKLIFSKIENDLLNESYKKIFEEYYTFLNPNSKTQFSETMKLKGSDFYKIAISIHVEKGHILKTPGYYLISSFIEK